MNFGDPKNLLFHPPVVEPTLPEVLPAPETSAEKPVVLPGAKQPTETVVAPQSPVVKGTTFAARSPIASSNSSPVVTRSGRVVKAPAKFADS